MTNLETGEHLGAIRRPRIVLAPVALISSLAGLTACSSGHHAGAPTPVTPLSTSIPTSGATTTSDTAVSSVSCPLSSPTGVGHLSPPTGLIAYRIYQLGQLPFVNQVFTDPFINGVDFSVPWKDLEPAFNRFNWAVLDCVFSQADQHGKFVVLTVVPGFETPRGCSPCRACARKASCSPTATMSRPDHSRYRGITTSVSTEMSLPDQTSGDTARPPSTAGSDITEWMSLGYTPATYVAAWEATFWAYHRLFPDQYLALSLFPGLPTGNNGTMDASAADSTRSTSSPPGCTTDRTRSSKRTDLRVWRRPNPTPSTTS